MAAVAADGEPSSSPSRLFPKSLRKSKASASSRASSIVDDGSSEGHSAMRSSLESAASKLKSKSSIDNSADGTNETSGLKALLSKAKPKKRRKRKEKEEEEQRAEEEVKRGRSVGERGTLLDEGKDSSRSVSRGSRGSHRSEASQLTYDSEDESNPTAPALATRQSHAGYLTLSSPLIHKTAASDDGNDDDLAANPPMSAIGAGPIHTKTFPANSSLSSSATSDQPPPPTPSPKHAATLPPSSGNSSRSELSALPVVTKFKEVFSSTSSSRQQDRSVSVSPDRDPGSATSASSSLKGLFGKNNEEGGLFSTSRSSTIASRRLSRTADSAPPIPPAIQTSGIAETPLRTGASRIGVIPATPPGQSGTPVTTVTPPTPTLPSGTTPSLASPGSDHTSDYSPSAGAAASASGHRRMRSGSSSKAPSGLSNAISAPLTPTIEEPRSTKNTPDASDRPGSSSGFFSTVFSAAQNAATSLGNTITNNPLAPGPGGRDRSASSASDRQLTDSTNQSRTDGIVGEPEPLTAENLGTVQGVASASMPSFGANGAGMATASHPSASSERLPASEYHHEVERFGLTARKENGSVHTVSSTTGTIPEEGGKMRGNVRSTSMAPTTETPTRSQDTFSGAAPPRTATESTITGERTPPGSRDMDRDSVFRRSGSVRSRTNTSLRRKRGSSAATTGIGAAIVSASNAALANPGANTSVPRLTGFAVASKKRNRDFHQAFRSVPEDDYLIEDYSAAFQKDILLHGRFYVSEGHICFSSNIFGYVTTLVINFDEVTAIEKKNTAMFIPNGLVIQTAHAKNVFASFTSRDSTYDLLVGIWKINHPNLKSTLNGVELDTGGGDRTEKNEGDGVAGSDDESDDESGDDEDVYDEDEEEEDEGVGSFTEAGEGSIAGSEVGGAGDAASKSGTRKPSAVPPTGAPTNGAPAANGDGKGGAEPGDAANGAATGGVDFPGPASHLPTECADGESHYDKIIKDDVIPAPLGKVYALLFGAQSGAFMSRWLADEQKVLELQLDDDRKGLGEGAKQRTYSYIKPLNGSIGPKQTKCIITEVLDAMNLEKAVSVTVTTQTPDVPSGNAFSTKTKYCLMWAEGNATRLLMNCTIEWTGKSWLKGPIEKGANDGQVAYANDILSALKSAVSSKSVRAAPASKAGKVRRRKKDSSAASANQATRAGKATRPSSSQANKQEHWGLFEPLRGPLSPVTDLLQPLLTSSALIGLLAVLLAVSWFRASRLASSSSTPQSSLAALTGLPTPERIAAYEEIWRREESELWDWLDERIAFAPGELGHQKEKGKQAPLRDAGREKTKMERRELEEAVRITQERLDALKKGLAREKGGVASSSAAAAAATESQHDGQSSSEKAAT